MYGNLFFMWISCIHMCLKMMQKAVACDVEGAQLLSDPVDTKITAVDQPKPKLQTPDVCNQTQGDVLGTPNTPQDQGGPIPRPTDVPSDTAIVPPSQGDVLDSTVTLQDQDGLQVQPSDTTDTESAAPGASLTSGGQGPTLRPRKKTALTAAPVATDNYNNTGPSSQAPSNLPTPRTSDTGPEATWPRVSGQPAASGPQAGPLNTHPRAPLPPQA